MSAKRKSPAEVQEAVMQIAELIKGGMTLNPATKKVGLADSVYRRAAKRFKLPTVPPKGAVPADAQVGKMDARAFPPRPKPGKGGKRPWLADDSNIMNVTKRLNSVERQLQKFEALRKERVRLRAIALKLLQADE